jgi:hypothetical protein
MYKMKGYTYTMSNDKVLEKEDIINQIKFVEELFDLAA